MFEKHLQPGYILDMLTDPGEGLLAVVTHGVYVAIKQPSKTENLEWWQHGMEARIRER